MVCVLTSVLGVPFRVIESVNRNNASEPRQVRPTDVVDNVPTVKLGSCNVSPGLGNGGKQ